MNLYGTYSRFVNFHLLLTVEIMILATAMDEANKEEPSSADHFAVHMKVANSCDSTASLVWANQGANESQGSQKCELTYFSAGQPGAQILYISLDSHSHLIRLLNLSQGENYTAFIVCGDFVTNKVSFISGMQCEDQTTGSNHTSGSLNTEEYVVPTYSHASGFDVVQWPIAVTFISVGVIICAVVAFYMWKKYQRRQRILRIFRQGQHDPFQALYSPTQDSYSF